MPADRGDSPTLVARRRTSAAINMPGQLSHRPFAYPAELLRADGTLDSEARVLRRVLVNDLGLKPRDIVALFTKDGRMGFDLNVRSGCLLLSLGRDGPAAIVGEDAAYVLSRDSPASNMGRRLQQQYLEVVSLAFTNSASVAQEIPHAEFESQTFSFSSGEQLLAIETSPALVPFALAATEALLIIFLDRLTSSLERTTSGCTSVLEGFSSSAEVSAYQLEMLRRIKQRLEYLKEQAKSLQKALFEALGDEDDLVQLETALGGTKEEWELCFEHYSQSVEEIGLEAFQQLESLEDLERTISLRLSSRRLELEKLQIYLDVFGNGLSVGALLTGAFGMNLVSGLETRPRLFWLIFPSIALACLGVSCGLQRFVVRRLRQGAI